MITLYAHHSSPNSRKVMWALEELAHPFKLEVVDLAKGGQKSPEYLKLNPNGRVPTLKDGDFVLYESNAILAYLGETVGQDKLLPTDPKKRALVFQWLSWQGTDIGPAISKPFLMKLIQSFGAPFDPVAHRQAADAAAPVVAILDAHLKGRQFVANDTFSIADIALCESLGTAEFSGVPLAAYANIQAYLKPLFERPACKKTRPPR